MKFWRWLIIISVISFLIWILVRLQPNTF
jgi:hypothetical protein